ncbi:MAG: DUF2147 domain-containing protein [Gammaproteobacteria bacterium]|nr:DUF2147 domain-containing protein [Gammaproteobacteria bacterium]
MRFWVYGWIWIALLGWAGVACADEREAVFGRWADERSILEISEQDGYLSARVIAMDDPVYREGEAFGPVGAARLDNLNPDEAKRQQPILGIELLLEYRFENDRWQGQIYDAESGNVYSSNMRVNRGGELQMRGYIGIPMFGRTAKFLPLGECADHVKAMLALAKLGLEGCEKPAR